MDDNIGSDNDTVGRCKKMRGAKEFIRTLDMGNPTRFKALVME